jgi:glutamate/tyrosine decarboxylase-like PLP-dependent enzyme
LHSIHSPEQLRQTLDRIFGIVAKYYHAAEGEKVVDLPSKQKVVDQFWEATPPEQGKGLDAILDRFQQEILPQSIKTWHPLFLNQMFAGASFPSAMGDLLASVMNPTLATWEMSPVATAIEQNVSQWMAQLLGMKAGSRGIFLPGGSLSNLLALTVARQRLYGPEIKTKGMGSDLRPVIFCSEKAHYSIANAAAILGVGSDQLIKVRSKINGAMEVDDLVTQLGRSEANGLTPMAVVATLGLTVSGCFDPLAEIAALCQSKGIHLHADAAFGGGMALTKEGKERLRGIEYADTVTWDAHKWLHMPLTCSVLLSASPSDLKATFGQQADYLFHPQEDLTLEDLGQSTPLCGKRFDGLKLWLVWQSCGTQTFRSMAEERLSIARSFASLVTEHPDYRCDYALETPLFCFRFHHASWPEVPSEGQIAYINRLHRQVREGIKQSGIAYFNITQLNGQDQFRMILINPLTRLSHLETLFGEIDERARAFVFNEPFPF